MDKPKMYEVRIIETHSRVVRICAPNEDMALSDAERKYETNEIHFSGQDYDYTNYVIEDYEEL